MSTVLLVGAFGQGNPGDEALCEAFVNAMADHQVVVASADPVDTAARHGIRAVANNAISTAGLVRSTDAVVVGGGTVFKSLHPSTGRRPDTLLRNAAALVAGARLSGTKVAMVGVGADDLRGRVAPRLARWLVRNVDLLVLRDEESAAALGAAGVPAPFWIGADPAWVLDSPPPAIGSRPRSVTIALSHLAADDRLLADLTDVIAPLCADHSVQLQPWQTGAQRRDHALASALQDRLGGAASIIRPPTDLADAAATFAGDRLVIALRFHALVAAAWAGTPTLAVAHEPKLAGLSRRLGQISVPAHASRDVLAASLAHALGAEPASPTVVRGEAQAARRALDLMALLLSGGDLAAPDELAGLPLSNGGGRW